MISLPERLRALQQTPDRPHDECGVVGVSGHPEAANVTYLGLYALQHRGQESAGIVSRDGRVMHAHRAMGLVGEVFKADVVNRGAEVGLRHVDHLSSKEGIPLYKDHRYSLVSEYNNTSGETQDSMAIMYLYLLQADFQRPVVD